MTNGMTVTLIVVFMAAAAFVVYKLIACKSRTLRRVLEGFLEKPRVRSASADTRKRQISNRDTSQNSPSYR